MTILQFGLCCGPKGIEKGTEQIARRMLADNEPIEKIVKYSGLTEEQVRAL